MKSAWTVLLISALTDGILAGYAALMAAISIDSTSINKLTLVAIGGGMVAAMARTVQQGLKAAMTNPRDPLTNGKPTKEPTP